MSFTFKFARFIEVERLYSLTLFLSPRRNRYAPIFTFWFARLSPLTHSPFDIPLGIPPGGVGALIVQLFTAADAQLYLDPTAPEICLQRDQRQALLLFEQPVQPVQLPTVQQQLFGPQRIAVEDIPFFVNFYASSTYTSPSASIVSFIFLM